MQAKFSMEFTLAIVAIERQAGLGEFTTDMLNRADVRGMMGKVDYAAYDAAGDGYTNVTTLIDVMLQDGAGFLGPRRSCARQHEGRAMDFEEVARKFRRLRGLLSSPGRANYSH